MRGALLRDVLEDPDAAGLRCLHIQRRTVEVRPNLRAILALQHDFAAEALAARHLRVGLCAQALVVNRVAEEQARRLVGHVILAVAEQLAHALVAPDLLALAYQADAHAGVVQDRLLFVQHPSKRLLGCLTLADIGAGAGQQTRPAGRIAHHDLATHDHPEPVCAGGFQTALGHKARTFARQMLLQQGAHRCHVLRMDMAPQLVVGVALLLRRAPQQRLKTRTQRGRPQCQVAFPDAFVRALQHAGVAAFAASQLLARAPQMAQRDGAANGKQQHRRNAQRQALACQALGRRQRVQLGALVQRHHHAHRPLGQPRPGVQQRLVVVDGDGAKYAVRTGLRTEIRTVGWQMAFQRLLQPTAAGNEAAVVAHHSQQIGRGQTQGTEALREEVGLERQADDAQEAAMVADGARHRNQRHRINAALHRFADVQLVGIAVDVDAEMFPVAHVQAVRIALGGVGHAPMGIENHQHLDHVGWKLRQHALHRAVELLRTRHVDGAQVQQGHVDAAQRGVELLLHGLVELGDANFDAFVRALRLLLLRIQHTHPGRCTAQQAKAQYGQRKNGLAEAAAADVHDGIGKSNRGRCPKPLIFLVNAGPSSGPRGALLRYIKSRGVHGRCSMAHYRWPSAWR